MEPVASAVGGEPMVWARFVSRMVAGMRSARNAATAITAAGMEAEMVNPTPRPREALAAPKTMPTTTPAAAALKVNSCMPATLAGAILSLVFAGEAHLD